MRWKLIVAGVLLALGLSATPAAAQWGYGSGGYTDGTRTSQANPYAPSFGMYTANLSYGYGPLPWYGGYRDYGLSYGPPYFGGYGYSSSGLSNNGNVYYNYPGLGSGSGWYGLPSAAACCRGLGPFVGRSTATAPNRGRRAGRAAQPTPAAGSARWRRSAPTTSSARATGSGSADSGCRDRDHCHWR